MANTSMGMEALEVHAERQQGRRAFFRAALGAAAVGSGAFLVSQAAQAQTLSEFDVLNFALNLEYLEANFYYYAVYGQAIPVSATGGTGAAGAATGGKQVTFSDRIIAEMAREIAEDELNHVLFLRRQLGERAVAQPAIDLSVSPTSAFSKAAQAATLIPTTASFDPYASDLNFLYGAFLFEDVGVTAYKGSSALITTPAYIDAAAGILAAEAYHAGIIRTTIDQMGSMPGLKASTVRGDTELVSTARDSLDGSTDLDQGIAYVASNAGDTSNIAPTDTNGLAFSRSAGQVLNIVYLTKAEATAGGFFPAGVNGAIRSSINNA
ncbi:ferritin-like domain-containing protein [Sphingomonas abaci]|nr:ferritin-like domain-containing protein [Sphingomonas abaci]